MVRGWRAAGIHHRGVRKKFLVDSGIYLTRQKNLLIPHQPSH